MLQPRVKPRLLFLLAVLVFALACEAEALAKGAARVAQPLKLDVPGSAPAYYYKPRSKGLRPIVMYLHGRGGNPQEDCRKWAQVAPQFGWLVCPSGPEDRGNGDRGWASSPQSAQKVMDATVAALRQKYRGRVKGQDNILIGFSEGAFMAQQVGLTDPAHWGRWLILAASDQYWSGDPKKQLETSRKKIKRIYLLTGENDQVAQQTVRVGDIVKSAKIPVQVRIAPGLGHEVPADRMITNYRRPLLWLSAPR